MPQFDREYRQGGSSPAHTLPPMTAPGKKVQQPGGAPPDFDPNAVQVDQYAQGTDLDRFNDCGPACVLMIIRAMGQEQALTALVAAQQKVEPAQVTLQQRMTYIRGKTGGTSDTALSFAQVKAILIAVLRDLKITLTDKELAKQLSFISDAGALTTNSDKPPGPTSPTRIQEYLAEHCGNGSAVIALGLPTKAAWGWGGTDDANHRTVNGKDGPVAQSIGDTGNHFVVVFGRAAGRVHRARSVVEHAARGRDARAGRGVPRREGRQLARGPHGRAVRGPRVARARRRARAAARARRAAQGARLRRGPRHAARR
jgi:hypothetical protein